MKHLLLTTIAAVLLVGCGRSVDIRTAVQQNRVKIVSELLDNGVNPDTSDEKGFSILAEASLWGFDEIVRLLIKKGANVNIEDIDGWTPLTCALNNNNKSTAELLIKNGAKNNPQRSLAIAVASGDLNWVNKHIEEDSNINKKDEYWHAAPIHYSPTYEITKLLIQNGANVNSLDIFGRTPLDYDYLNYEVSKFNLLRKHGGKTGEELKAEGK